MLRHRLKYRYKPLPKGHIRLLKLLPGSDKDRIKCRLHTAILSENPVFEALSYEWGEFWWRGKPNPPIQVDGRSFVVRPNLGWALQHLRDVLNERVLWIDAICINQDDEEEKAVQIKQMGRVYSQAAITMVWLGPASKHSEMTIQFFRRLATDPLIDDETLTSLLEPERRPRLDEALYFTLNGNSYWYRLWILQEILLGKCDIILCFGGDRMSWDVLSLGMVRLRRYLKSASEQPGLKGLANDVYLRIAVENGGAACLQKIRLARELSPSPEESSLQTGDSLRYVIGLAQSAKCKELRDKIYGLLGMTDFNMPVDYRKDMFDLYTEALQHFCQVLKRLSSDPMEIHMARLSQIFQNLLKGPLLLQSLKQTVSCFRISGILSGQIVQVEGGATRALIHATYKDQEDTETDLRERLQPILLSFEESTGCTSKFPEERLAHELSMCPKRHLVLPCLPSYFQATRRATNNIVKEHIPKFVTRRGSVPTRSDINRLHRYEPHIFIASSLQRSSSSEATAEDFMRPLIGFATPDAQVEDRIVRFLETDICLVVRHSAEGEYKFVGCANIPQIGDSATDPKVDEEATHIDRCSFRGSAPNYVQFQSTFQNTVGDGVDIVIDSETLQFVTSIGLQDFREE